MRTNIKALLATGLLASMATPAFAVTEITWWHSMQGALGERVAGLADQFNKSQSDYKVNAVFKGNYEESMAAAIAAFRAGNA
ncbi:MAG: sn-glycerol 3-phosphate transport system substrate-binding protein, partial [Burkholderiales bacterium]